MLGEAAHRITRFAPLAALTVIALLALPAASPAAGLKERLDRTLESATERTPSPGAQAAILEDGEHIWSGAVGAAIEGSHQPVTGQSLFAYASFSKMMLAAYALDRVERGRLALDEPIAGYIGDSVPGSNRVTLRMLLTHTAGYPQIYASPELWDLFGKRYDPNRRWSYGLVLDALDRPREPGSRFRYSNAAFIVLSYVMRETAARPLHRAYTEFLAPAGISGKIGETDVTMRLSARAEKRFAHGYQFALSDGRPPNLFAGARRIPTDLYGLPWGDGLFAGTACGAAEFLDGLMVRRTLLDPATLDVMFTPSEQSREARDPYGLGTYRIRAAGRRWQGHSGTYGGYTSMGFTDRQTGVTVVVLANGYSAKRAGSPARAVWRELARAYGSG